MIRITIASLGVVPLAPTMALQCSPDRIHDTSDLVRPRNRTGNGIRDSIMPTLYL